MIPSDHFVRFYNEVFKFLDVRDGLEDYYLEISRDQEQHCFELFWRKGLDGMVEYWDGICVEENCVMKNAARDGMYLSGMDVCPSLSKVLDNDASPCLKYCNHCAGWVMPLMTKCGFYSIDNVMGMDVPSCHSCITESREKALAWIEQEKKQGATDDMFRSNLGMQAEVERNQAARHRWLKEQGLE